MKKLLLVLVLVLLPTLVVAEPPGFYKCVATCRHDLCFEQECESVCRWESDCFLDCMDEIDDCDDCIEVCE